ncbi:hypothetical protein CA850_14375 [Micromonospora echinospora]|uniref:AMP-binding enzyme n=1 Tax=Micromonospora echinospora TaxID=1877 RepID=A0A1C4ZAB5_MICEC|nr:acyl-CoA synthetase [Micromonospora echinospora]OZV80533.1 hypothetical protein CA850_14375 [Micromonospora echinospora]SCF29890.1 AMP-binding enzyme [Micromonospora echinospora]
MIPFRTSGTTGPAVTWWRGQDQLDAEARLLLPLLGRVDRVLSFAPSHHLYGRIFGVELPRLAGVPVVTAWTDPLVLPPLTAGIRCLVVCLPSTWPLLRRHVGRLRGNDLVAVHSTACTTPATHDVVDLLGLDAVEVLGSTETGAVATRPITRDGCDWTLLPDVEPLPAADGRLHVSGPRLAASLTSHRTGDLVEFTGARTFRHLGRSGGLVKVNGRRCDTEAVAALVSRMAPGCDARCVPVTDPIRGEHYDLYYSTGPEPAELRRMLAAVDADLPAPRLVRRVPTP